MLFKYVKKNIIEMIILERKDENLLCCYMILGLDYVDFFLVFYVFLVFYNEYVIFL